jgi:hypothetical protein
MGLAIALDDVVKAGAAGCSGEWFGGSQSVDYSHDLWTIRCPAIANVQQMQDNLRSQLEDLGMTIRDFGNNAGPNGDVAYEINYGADQLLGTARMVVLGEGDGQIIVFTIDQTPR